MPALSVAVYVLDYAAGDFFARVARRLTVKIVGCAVYNDGFADDIIDSKAVGQHSHPGVTAALEKGRQIAGMVRVIAPRRVKMPHCVGKGVGGIARAFASRMDMKGENAVLTGRRPLRQSENVRRNINALLSRVKENDSSNIGVLRRPVHKGGCVRIPVPQLKKHIGRHMIDKNNNHLMQILCKRRFVHEKKGYKQDMLLYCSRRQGRRDNCELSAC